jgi:hypothetical protein
LAICALLVAGGSGFLVRAHQEDGGRLDGRFQLAVANRGTSHVASFNVDSVSSLVNALKSASGGDVISLAPGTYSGLALKNLTFNGGVTLTSADPAQQAVITDFTLTNVKGVTFSNLDLSTLDHPDFVAKGIGYWAFNIKGCDEIHFDNVKIHGSLDGDASNDVEGLSILNSTNVSVANTEFQQLERAMAIGQTQNVNVTGNHAHDLRSDGFDFAEVANVKIVGNLLHDFTPNGSDHPDAIQFWTSGTKTPSHDILISQNVILRGDGAYTQGIFLRDQLTTLPYERVTISDNLVVGTGYNGIRISGAKDLILARNELITFEGDNKTTLLVQRGEGISTTGNRGTAMAYDTSSGIIQTDNVTTMPVGDKGAAILNDWYNAHPDVTHVTQPPAVLPVPVVDFPSGTPPYVLPTMFPMTGYFGSGWQFSID